MVYTTGWVFLLAKPDHKVMKGQPYRRRTREEMVAGNELNQESYNTWKL